jgi:hypothetical protein
MRRALAIVPLLLATASCRRDSAPVRAYKEFSEHLANERYDSARAMADGAALDQIQFHKAVRDFAGIPREPIQAVYTTVESETVSGAAVHIIAVQEVVRGQTITHARGMKMRQRVTLEEVEGRWIVTSFEEERVE